MEKIILYYKFVPVADPDITMRWQRELCQRLGLRGRIIIAGHGINGTLGGDIEALREYKRSMNRTATFKGIDYKWTLGSAEDFPRLSIKVRPELVAFGLGDSLKVDESGVIGGGRHLTPAQVNALVAERGDEVVFFDGRNAYEAEIGRFEDAVIPPVATTHDFLDALDDPEIDALKHRPVVAYCTGGIRCEILTAAMRDRGFGEVYQIDGGLVRYISEFGEQAHWKGSLYTFDRRMVVDFEDRELSTLGSCDTCAKPVAVFRNCDEPSCKERFLRCDQCAQTHLRCIAHSHGPAPATSPGLSVTTRRPPDANGPG